jgi:hypothetical protein
MFGAEGKDGVILTLGDGWCNHNLGTRGDFCRMWLPQWWNLNVDVLRAGKICEKLCGDLMAIHLRKCMMGKWRLLIIDGWWSHQPVGKVVQPLQSVNCHDSRAHGHERHWPFTWLVRFFWLGSLVWVGSSRSGYGVQQVWNLGACLATGGMPVSFDRFMATGVTSVSLRPLITVGNPGAWSCLDIV